MKTAGLILAAGESRRMGFPKALLEFRGKIFLDHLVDLFSAHCSPVIAVLGANADAVRAMAKQPAAFVVNPDYALGQTTSMQCGLRAVPGDADGVLFTLVDHPAVKPATLDALVNPAPPEGILLRVPRYGEKRGHPIWISRELFPEFLALPSGGAARDVVRSHAGRTEFLDLDDAGVIADIDSAEDYRSLSGGRREPDSTGAQP